MKESKIKKKDTRIEKDLVIWEVGGGIILRIPNEYDGNIF